MNQLSHVRENWSRVAGERRGGRAASDARGLRAAEEANEKTRRDDFRGAVRFRARGGFVWGGRRTCEGEAGDFSIQVLDVGEHGVGGRGAEHLARFAEAQGEAPDDPDHGHEAHRHEVLHDDGQHVLLAHETAVEEREAGGHEVHQRRADDDERGRAAVDGHDVVTSSSRGER